ncbi:MAG: DUF2309 domain-containing protein [Rhodanobacter sp.]
MTVTALKLSRPASDIAVAAPAPLEVQAIAGQVTRRIAPLWPLKHFVAVNPFLGLTEHQFADAAQLMALVAGARMTMPRSFYLDAIASGRIRDDDLALALQRSTEPAVLPHDVAALRRSLETSASSTQRYLSTAADAVSEATGRDWSSLACERISLWAASHFDEGQAPWLSPGRHLDVYSAWREEALIDRTPELMGLPGFRRILRSLPATAEAMISEGIARLQLDDTSVAVYFHRLLMTVAGWAGYARYQVWQSELHERSDTTLIELLALRLAWDVAILEAHRGNAVVAARWTLARERLGQPITVEPARAVDLLLQSAYEIGWQRSLLAPLRQVPNPLPTARKAVQAVFCIDVRSEVFRRALESVSATVDTLGFAGFFGMPIEFVPLGRAHGGAHCPVLLTPAITVHEVIKAASTQEKAAIIGLRRLRLRAAATWRWFKLAAVSSFAFVEAIGCTYAGKLVSDTFGISRPVPAPATDGIDVGVAARLVPSIEPEFMHGHLTGIALDTRVKLAEGVLKAMSLRQDFARLVVLVGHAASSVNNPHASGLDCGACGGHSGAANARVAAAVLNDSHVRRSLLTRGISIPRDTWFIGALHNTTTDEVTIFDRDDLPVTHADELVHLQHWLAAAGVQTRMERAARLNLHGGRPVDAQILARSRDWSQVRPEWGLAGCAAYLVAPRSRTVGVDLGGRAFLNSYDWHQDEGFTVLESIMTAPMVVGAWINLQYYGSAVDNHAFGSGNKVLHNVVGKLGVLEGNGGDLRSGLPWQSVHDGQRLIHEPLRLSVVIAAPLDAINAVIARHESVSQLVDNGWIHLFAMPDAPLPLQRYRGALQWECAE